MFTRNNVQVTAGERQLTPEMSELMVAAEDEIAAESGIYDETNNNVEKSMSEVKLSDDDHKMTLDECLRDVTTVIDMFLSNDIDGAISRCESLEKHSLYHSLAKSFIKFIIAIIHLEDGELTSARDQIKKTIALIASKRRSTSIIESMSNVLFWRQYNYNDYTDEQVHAELLVAEVQIVLAFINILGEQSLVSMLTGALRIRNANSNYRLCRDILKHRTNWSSQLSQENFKAGYLLGHGLFNLFLSHFPTNVLKLLSVVGFTGDYFTAIDELREVAEQLKSSIRSRLCQIVCIFYLLYIEYGFGIGGKSASWAEAQVADLLDAYPDGALAQLLAGRLDQIKGYPDRAVGYFLKCLHVNLHWKSLGAACYWDLAWCSARQMNWLQAADYTRCVTRVSHYSPAIMEYQYACFLLMHLDSHRKSMSQDDITSITEQIDSSMKLVPTLRIRYAGKTVPPEKFSVIRSQQYNSGERSNMLLPALELYYMWNMFSHCTANVDTHLPYLKLIDEKMNETKDSAITVDDKCFLLLLKGVILRTLGNATESISYFKQILDLTESIVHDHYIPPHAAFELGFSYMQAGNITDAKYWLEKARSDYTGFLIESMVHLKVHACLVSIKRFQESGQSDHIKIECNESASEKKKGKKFSRSISTGPLSWSSKSSSSSRSAEVKLNRQLSTDPEMLSID